MMVVLDLALCLMPGILYASLAGWWRRLSRTEALFGSLAVSLLVSGWLGLALSHVGRFSLTSVSLASAALCVVGFAAWLALRRGGHSPARPALPGVRFPTSRVGTVALPAILLIALWLHRMPGELVFGNHDAGARLDSSVHLAQAGTFYVVSPTLPAARATGVMSTPVAIGDYCNSPAIVPLLPDDPCLVQVPQFNGINEVWLAISYSLLGWTRWADVLPGGGLGTSWPTTPLFLYFTPLSGLAALMAMWLAGRLLFGQTVALLGTAMLAVSYPQVYYGNTSMSEVPTQLALLASLWGLARFYHDGDRYAALFAGFALGVAQLVRVDVLALYGLVGIWVLWAALTRRLCLGHWYFLVPAGILFGHAALQYGHFASPYFWYGAGSLWQAYRVQAVIGAAAAGAALALAVVVTRKPAARVEGILAWLAVSRHRTYALAGVVALTACVWGMWALLQPRQALGAARAVLMLSWYLSPLTLLAAGAGVVLLLWRGVGWLRAPLISAGLLFAMVLLVTPYITPAHVFWVRRFVPVVLPCLVLCGAYAVVEAAKLAPRRASVWLGSGLAVLLLVSLAWITVPLATADRPEWAGATAQTARLGRLLEPKSVVLLEPSPAAGWEGLPLTLIYGQSAYLLSDQWRDGQANLARAIQEWRDQGRSVYVLADGGALDGQWSGRDLRAVGEVQFSFPYLYQAFDHLPKARSHANASLRVYAVVR